MIEKNYFVGQWNTSFFIGIQRKIDGIPIEYDPTAESQHNGVHDGITGRVFSSIDKVTGYLAAIRGELAWESPDVEKGYMFRVGFYKWTKMANGIFGSFLKSWTPDRVLPLKPYHIEQMKDTLIDVKFKEL